MPHSRRETYPHVDHRIRNRTAGLALALVTVGGALLAPAAGAANAQVRPAADRPLSAAQAAALSRDPNTPVIVLLREQPAGERAASRQAAERNAVIDRAQRPLLAELAQVNARHVHAFHVIDAVAATVSAAEARRLASDPAVRAVLPDSVVRLPKQAVAPGQARTSGNKARPDMGGWGGGPLPGSNAVKPNAVKPNAVKSAGGSALPAGVCPAAGQTMLEPEALPDTHTQSDDPNAPTARSLGYTGSGVRVGIIDNNLDVNNPDFVRPDGSHVFAGFRDYTGEGTGNGSILDEEYLDASAIAAQGATVHDVQNFGAPSLPTACDIRVVGMAPGATLYGYNVWGRNTYDAASEWVQAIDDAVNVDHVDIINESVYWSVDNDVEASNIINLANDGAVQAGVTVVTSTGDAGTQNSVSTPATNPNVISVGASTTLRWDMQTNYSAARQFATGWLNDNVTPLSSTGYNQAGRTIDLMAPGDGSFADCTANATLYPACVDLLGKPSDLVRSGGTSEASPLVAGAAALVIQSYRQAHGGASPTPALIKQILTSTADDETIPAPEQGAGLVDSYRAVLAAASVADGNGTPAASGSSLLVDQSQLDATGAPGSSQSWTVHVTNAGAATQTVNLSNRTFGPAQGTQDGTVTLNDTTSSHFTDWTGIQNNYATVTFAVPAGAAQLNASLAYPAPAGAGPNARVRFDLIDPSGRLASTSVPQGTSDYSHADVRLPTAGSWTAVIFSPVSTAGGTVGQVRFESSTSQTTATGSVSPATLTLAPGQTGAVTVTAPIPARAGDASAALVVSGSGGQRSSVPIILRGLVEPGSGGVFSGTLYGGNGRETSVGQTDFYQFDVPSGQRDVDAQIDLTNDPSDSVDALLVDPSGQVQAIGTNQLPTAYDPATRTGTFTNETNTDLYARSPVAGRWTLVVSFPGQVAGDEIAQAYHGSIAFDQVSASGLTIHTQGTAGGRPQGRMRLRAGQPVGLAIPVTNTGDAPMDVFLDPRRAGSTTMTLAPVQPAGNVTVPITYSSETPEWLVPNETTQLNVTASSSVPVRFDIGPESGDPDLLSSSGTTATVTATGSPMLQSGPWGGFPSQLAPYTTATPPNTVTMAATATTQPFDPTVVPNATNLWQSAVTPATSMNLVTVQPGQTVVLTADVNPTGLPGSTVSGTLYVDQLVVGSVPALYSYNFNDFGVTAPSANELAAVPYRYTVS
jgi:hypothetical protein